MGKKSKGKEDKEVRDIRIKVRIEPAFRLIIESDSTGKSWSGHSWYGDTSLAVLRRMKTSLTQKEYANDELHITSSTPHLVPAISWKEPVIVNRD